MKKSGQRKISISLTIPLAIVIVIMFIFFLFRLPFVGFVVKEQFFTYTDILDINLTEDMNLTWTPEYAGKIVRVVVSGIFIGLGTARVYLSTENKSYLVFNSDELETIDYSSFEAENRTEENTTIDLVLEYKTGTPWDIDDDGIDTDKGIVDLTVENTEFDVNESGLCTRWEVYSVENETSSFVCYGSENCCEFIGLIPSLERWNETFNSFFGRLEATHSNIIRAQLIYVGETIEKSNWKALKAVFLPEARFSDVCIETCSFELNNTSYDLVVEVENSFLALENLTYTIKAISENRAPELVRTLPNITTKKNKKIEINLTNYFYDADNDKLKYSVLPLENFSFKIVKDTLIIKPEHDFVGNISLVIQANDKYDITISNEFIISFQEVPDTLVITLETFNLPASVGEKVNFVRRIDVTNNKKGGNIKVTTVLPIEAENISVFDTKIDTILSSDDFEIEIDDSGWLNGLDEVSFATEELKKIKEKKKGKGDDEEEKERGEKEEKNDKGKDEEEALIKKVNFKSYLNESETRIFEVYYVMPEVNVEEEIVNIYTKRITVISDFNYTNISVETDMLIEAPQKDINLYLVRENSSELFDSEYLDTDEDQLVDKVKWLFSGFNQTFELVIELLSIEYSTLINRNWEIAFSTLIEGNLSIRAVNGTLLGEEIIDNSSTIDDVRLDILQCGNKAIFNNTHTELGLYFTFAGELIPGYNVFANSLDIDGIFIENYSCDNIGYLTSTLLNLNQQYLEFEFYGRKKVVVTEEVAEAIDCAENGCLYIKDSCGCNRAIFNGRGSLFIDGILGEFTQPSENDFIIEDRDKNVKMWVDDKTGNLYLFGELFETAILEPSGDDDFIIQDKNGNVTAHLDGATGNLYLKGRLQENYFEICTC